MGDIIKVNFHLFGDIGIMVRVLALYLVLFFYCYFFYLFFLAFLIFFGFLLGLFRTINLL